MSPLAWIPECLNSQVHLGRGNTRAGRKTGYRKGYAQKWVATAPNLLGRIALKSSFGDKI